MSTPAGLDGRDASTAPATSEGQVELLKAAFRRHATGVALVTASGPDGPVGLTASSVASVSTRPPALSFSVLTGSATGRIVAEADQVDVHLLPAALAGVADAFGRTAGARFTPEQGWLLGPEGAVLPEAVASLRCVPVARVPVGEAVVVVAEVRAVVLGPVGDPLVYHDRAYRTAGPRLEV